MVELLLEARQLNEKIHAMASAMADLVDSPDSAAIIGIRTRGAILAQRIHKILALEREWMMPVGILDITLYRDDLSQLATHPLVRKTHLDFDVTGRTILLIDDVFYTGRTIRSAIDEIIDFGRPKAIRLGVLIERDGREYPIRPDYAALHVKTKPTQDVKVCLVEIDGDEKVILADKPPIPPDDARL